MGRTGDVFVSTEPPMRELVRLSGLIVACFLAVEIVGVLLLIGLPIREVLPKESRALPELMRLPELAAGCFAAVGADDPLVLIKLPMREFEFARGELGFAVGCFFTVEIVGVLLLIELPIREVLPELAPLPELAAGCFATVGADGLIVLIELPTRELDVVCNGLRLAAGCFFAVEIDGVLLLIKLTIREALLELTLLLELVVGCFAAVEADGILVLIELPMRELNVVRDELELVVGCLFTTDTDGALLPIELPIRDVLLELMRVLARLEVRLRLPTVLELVVVCLPVLELTPVDLPVAEELDEGREMPGDVLDCAVLRLDITVLERPVVGALLVNVLLELLRLDVTALERLIVGARLDVTLLGLRLDVIVLDREVVGVLLVNVLLELLRLGVLDLVGVRTEREPILLRLLAALAGALDLGAGAGFGACVFWLLLLDDPLFLELFAAKTGSADKKRSTRQEAITSKPSRRDSAILIFDI